VLLKHYRKITYIICFILLVSCSHKPKDNIKLQKDSFKNLPGWEQDDHDQVIEAFNRSCKRIKKISPNGEIRNSTRTVSFGKVKDWLLMCERSQYFVDSKVFFEENFTPYLVTNNGKEKGLFTGYYEVALKGSLTKSKHYHVPLYKYPDNLKLSTHRREDIAKGALKNKNLELVYVNDHVKAYFLEVQGSGKVELENGKIISIGYAGKNGHKYRSIGNVLVEQKQMSPNGVSGRTIKQWLYDNKHKAQQYMNHNPSYVFFQINQCKDGPIGAHSVELYPERSIAIDNNFIPYGVPIFVATKYPRSLATNPKPFNKLMMTQDTGGAIRGPVRGDIFFGYGDKAEKYADHMKEKGQYWVLVPNHSPNHN
jgi:membrane-bound lytic murein transglycosylase A